MGFGVVVAVVCFVLFCIALGIGFIYRSAKCHDDNKSCKQKHKSMSTWFFIASAILLILAMGIGALSAIWKK